MKHRQSPAVTPRAPSASWFGGATEARREGPGVVGAAMTCHNVRIMQTSRYRQTQILVLVT